MRLVFPWIRVLFETSRKLWTNSYKKSSIYYTTTWLWSSKCFGLSWHKVAIPLYKVWNELEIRMNRSRPTHSGAQIREPRPGFTTKLKLLERMKYKLSFLHSGVQRTCSCCLYFYGIGRNEFLSFWSVFNIQQLHFPLR